MHAINAAVVRLEETLTNQFLDIPPANLSILEYLASKNVVLGLSSRSSIAKLESYLKKKKIDHLFSFLIGSYGGQYKNLRTGREIDGARFDHQAVVRQASKVSSLPVSCGVWNGHGFTFDKPGLFPLIYSWSRYKSFSCSGFSRLNPDQTYFKLLLTGSKALLGRLQERFDSEAVAFIPYTNKVVDLIPTANSPWNALQHALADFDLKPEHVLTFSSSAADASLTANTYGIVMKNSCPVLFPLARRVAKYNGAQNGIAYMINVLIMEKACVFTDKKPEESQ